MNNLKMILKRIPVLGLVLLTLNSLLRRKKKTFQSQISETEKSLMIRQSGLKVGIIGAGPQGRAIASAVQSFKNIELTMIADLSELVLNELESKYSIKCHHKLTDFREIRKIGKLDLICISTTAPSHKEISIEVLKLGLCKKLLIEKPFAMSVSECKEIEDVAKNSDTAIFVNHSRRWLDNYISLKSLIQNSNNGKITGVSVFFGSGGISNLGVHFIDIVNFIIGSDVKEVLADLDNKTIADRRGEVDPGGRVWLKYLDGSYAFLDFSEQAKFKGKKIIINMEKGRIEFDERFGMIEVANDFGRREFKSAQGDLTGHHRVRPVLAGILNEDIPGSSGSDGSKAIEILAAIKVSNESRKTVPLPLDKIHYDLRIEG